VRAFPNPVLVGPILRVGDQAPLELTAAPIGKVKGEAKTSSASGASTHYEQRGGDVYRVEQSAYASSMSDDIFRSLFDATGGRRDVFVVVDDLKVAGLTHMSLFGYAAMELTVEGRVFEQSALESGREAP